MRSFLNKIDDVNATVCTRNVDIFAATETWLHNGINDNIIQISGYVHFRCDRQLRRGGGVCVWSHSSINVKRLVPVFQLDFIEAVWIYLCQLKIIFVCIYIPPDFSIASKMMIDNYFISNADHFLERYCDCDLIICGDLNRYDTVNISNHLDLSNLVNETTREHATLDY